MSSDITTLRKSGYLNEAYSLAQKAFDDKTKLRARQK